MSLATAKRSTGKAGEAAAEIWFARHDWQMYKVPPDVRVCGQTGRPGVFLAAFKAGGRPDFMGLVPSYQPYEGVNVFRAVEAKEAHGDSWPASKLSKAQREFMAGLPPGTAFVSLLWDDGSTEMFPFIGKGSYKKGEGQI